VSKKTAKILGQLAKNISVVQTRAITSLDPNIDKPLKAIQSAQQDDQEMMAVD